MGQHLTIDNIKESLELLGLKAKEAAAYIGLLKFGQANAQQIAKEAKLERTAIYPLLNNLCDKGLAQRIVKGKRYLYAAEPVRALEQFFKGKISLLDNLLPQLARITKAGPTKPIVKYYDTLPDIKRALSGRVGSREKLVRDFVFIDNLVEVFGRRFIHDQVEKRVANKVRALSLRHGPKEKDIKDDWYIRGDNKDLLREVRYLPPKFQFNQSLIAIYDNTVGIFSSEKELFALIIESKEFSQAMKTLFDIAWATARS